MPKYTWSDLVDALEPNGRSSDGVLTPDGNRTSPIGIEKKSYVDFFYNDGMVAGRYAPPGQDPTADMTNWYAVISAGERPTSQVQAAPIINQIATYRSAFYQDNLIAADVAGKKETPVFAPQGWTDSLFPESQVAAMIKRLRTADPNWPAYMWASNLGHPLADNSSKAVWQPINDAATKFLDLYVLRSGGANPSAIYQEQLASCDGSAGKIYAGDTLSDVARGTPVNFRSTAIGVTASPSADAAGPATDPIAFAAGHGSNGGCVTIPNPADTAASTSWTFPVGDGFTLLGEPALQLQATVAGTDAEIDARLWDVAPNGSATLVTRAAYRWQGSAGPVTIEYALQGNGWRFASDHRLRIQITQSDSPYLRLDNYASSVVYSSMILTLPVA